MLVRTYILVFGIVLFICRIVYHLIKSVFKDLQVIIKHPSSRASRFYPRLPSFPRVWLRMGPGVGLGLRPSFILWGEEGEEVWP